VVDAYIRELIENAEKSTLWSMSFDYGSGLGYFDSPESELRIAFELDKFLSSDRQDEWHSDMTGREIFDFLWNIGANPSWSIKR